MSASDKKKLRKEQNAAAMTEKQRTEKKNKKKETIWTVTFLVAMILVVAIFLTTALQAPIRDLSIRASTAVTVNGHKVSGTELNYFYVDAMGTFTSQFSSYGTYATMIMQMYGFNPTASVGSQVYKEETGETWADYFAKNAVETAKWTYAMYDKAMEEGFALTEEQKNSIASYEQSLKTIAEAQGISVNKYVQSIFGSTASLKTYMEYYELTAIATAYASKYYDGLEFTDEQLRAHEKDKYNEFSSYSYATFTITVSNYLEGGTKGTDEKGNSVTTYTDEEKKAAQEAALADAKALIENETIVDEDTMNLAIGALKNGKGKSCTAYNQILFTSLSISDKDMKEWVTSDDRKAGEMEYFETKSTTEGDDSITSYTVVLYLGCNDNTTKEATVRHLLVKFEGGTTNSSTGQTTYTEAEKKKAKEEAEKLLEQFKAGEQTEEAFIALLKEHSDDKDSKGNVNNEGLYEDITPASGYVEAFWEWAYAEHKAGDVGIIESEFGYHIMYYVKAGEHSYRDLLVESALASETYTAWEEAVMAAITVVESKKVKVNEDFIVPASFYTSTYSY